MSIIRTSSRNSTSGSGSTSRTERRSMRSTQVLGTNRSMNARVRELHASHLLNNMHQIWSIGQVLVGIHGRISNLVPHEIRDTKAATISTKASQNLRSILTKVNGISKLGVNGVADQVVQHIEVRLQVSGLEIRMST